MVGVRAVEAMAPVTAWPRLRTPSNGSIDNFGDLKERQNGVESQNYIVIPRTVPAKARLPMSVPSV